MKSGRRSFLVASAFGVGGAAVHLTQMGSGEATAAAGASARDVAVALSGARGDGTTDDTAAIQRAIDAVTPIGGSVFFPTGR